MNDGNSRLKKNIIALESHKNLRLDKFLSEISDKEIGETISRSRILDLIKEKRVQVNGQEAKPSHKVSTGDLISISLPQLQESTLTPYDFPLEILYEDSDCLVVNKPSGLVVHPSAGHHQDTLVNALLSKVSGLTIGIHEKRPGIVHRLDKDTSGILVVAKNDFSLERLARQFKQRTVRRHYLAIVYGEMGVKSGTISSHLGRHPTQRKKFASVANGKHAVTHFEKLDFKKGLSLLRCRLETGRTHQIRVHLSEKGHGIVGDPIYGTNRPLKSLNTNLREIVSQMNGIALHAYELGFEHPRSGESLIFQVPWPENLKALVEEVHFAQI